MVISISLIKTKHITSMPSIHNKSTQLLAEFSAQGCDNISKLYKKKQQTASTITVNLLQHLAARWFYQGYDARQKNTISLFS